MQIVNVTTLLGPVTREESSSERVKILYMHSFHRYKIVLSLDGSLLMRKDSALQT